MGRKIEPLTGGLVTDKDPALLNPGELSDIRNMVYKNGAAALQAAAGRAGWATAASGATAVSGVVGLRDVAFDNGDRYLLAHVGTKYRAAAITGATFSDLVTLAASGTQLEVVQYRNRFFLMNGSSSNATAIGSNVVAYLSATAANSALQTRTHGLLPVIAAPTVATASGGVFSQSVTGYYEYWTTEVAKSKQDGADAIFESAFSSDNGPTTVLVSATSIVPTIQEPLIRNASTTHWRTYRSPKKDKASDKKFPSGFMISEVSTAASSVPDTSVATSTASFPATANASGVGLFYGDFASASSMFADDATYASATVGSSVTEKQQGLYAFNLGGFTGTVNGIVVEVQGYVQSGSAPVPIHATIGKRNTLNGSFVGGFGPTGFLHTASKSGNFTSTNAGAPTTLSLGSATDRWFPSNTQVLSDTDFDGQFMVVLSVSKPNAVIGVDYVKVTVYYGASIDSQVQFPTVVYTFGDITSQVAKNFPPPSASTGDLFQDSLVTNDVSNPSMVRYSFPGEPEYFPPTYFIDFETRENDVVRAIRVVNNRLMVGLDSSLWRINYLPSERDASFDRGRAIEMVSRSYGIVNPMCCCTYTVDGETEQMAFVSRKGIHTTDGFNFLTRSRNQDWRRYISLTSTARPIALLNNPEGRELLFYYQNNGDTDGEYYMCLHLSYDRADIDKEGNFKFSGPVCMQNFSQSGGGLFASLESAWAVPKTSGDTAIYLGYGGNSSAGASSTAVGAGVVYLESETAAIPARIPTYKYTTRRIYAAGMSAEWMLDDLYGYCGSYTGAPLMTYTFEGTKTNDAGPTARGSKATLLGGQKLHHLTPKVQVEGLRITMTCQTDVPPFQQELLILGSTNYGVEDAGDIGMRDFPGIPVASIPHPSAPDFHPRVQNAFSIIDIWARDMSAAMARLDAGQNPSGAGTNVFGNITAPVGFNSLSTVQGTGDLSDIQDWNNAAGTRVARMNYFGALDLPVLNLIDGTGAAQLSLSGSGDLQANGSIVSPNITATLSYAFPDGVTYGLNGFDNFFSIYDTSNVAKATIQAVNMISGDAVYDLPSVGGFFVMSAGALTVSTKTLATDTKIRCDTATGTTFTQGSLATTGFRFDNSAITSTNIRNIKTRDVSGSLVLVGNTASASGVLGTIALTGQTGSLGAQTLLTGTTTTAGLYRLSFYLKCTTAGTAGSNVTATAAWNDGTAQTLVVPFENATVIFNGCDLGTGNAFAQGSIVVKAAASQNITFTTTITIVGGSPAYSIDARIEALG